jgi:aspartyl-tRNA synthetase
MFDRICIKEAISCLGDTVTLAGWVKRTRELRNISFLVLRDRTGEIQVTVKDHDMKSIVADLGREDVVLLKGKVITSDIVHDGVEFIPEKIEVLNKAKQPLPFDLFGKVESELDTRLNYRFMDFRSPKTNAIFMIQNELLKAFREFLTTREYVEFQPPCIIASASEGGAELFRIPYFEKMAFLAQSPQLYKQMAAISFEKVYTITPVWRAEKFNTPTHLNEVRQMDIEQAFADDETVMKVLEEVLVYMLKAVKENSAKELELLGREIDIPEIPFRRFTYTEAVDMLQSAGEQMNWGEDFSKIHEKKLEELTGEKAFFIKNWPSIQKAFYAMPHKEDSDVVHAFDLLYNGIELSSGTMRIHIPDLLRQQLKKKGLDPEVFTHYIESFSFGAPPHAGWSIGLERLTMTVTGMSNIRECCMFPRDRDRLVP